MIIKSACPILEYSTEREAVINPRMKGEAFPELCLVTFFEEVFDKFVEEHSGIQVGVYSSEMKDFPVYKVKCNEIEFCVCQAVVASGSIAMMTEWLYGNGVEMIICCGGCGVLDDIPAGEVIVPVRALRDEGASYKYLPPSRFVEVSPIALEAIKASLEKLGVAYVEGATWSTDGFYRETKDMVEYRREEGCVVVEMECATMAAIAQFRGKVFGQVLYSGDILVGNEEYDDRDWYNNMSARERLFYVAQEAICILGSK